jgi:hypothetical protein
MHLCRLVDRNIVITKQVGTHHAGLVPQKLVAIVSIVREVELRYENKTRTGHVQAEPQSQRTNRMSKIRVTKRRISRKTGAASHRLFQKRQHGQEER